MAQVYCKLQNLRTKFKNDDPEIKRVLREEFQQYQRTLNKQPNATAKGSTAKLFKQNDNLRQMGMLARRMWSREEMDTLIRALGKYGVSVSAIARELKQTRSQKQVLQKLINMKKWPGGCDPAIIKIINEGRLSIKT